MCTSVKMRSIDNISLLARTMDFSFELDPSMVIVPKNHPISFFKTPALKTHHAFMGLSKNINDGYVFADGVNEFGLSGAVLYFEGYASYNDKTVNGKINLAPYEVLSYIFSTCKNTEDVKEAFTKINLVDIKLDFIGSTPPFHWVFLDNKDNSIIVEPLASGINIHENRLGVMANSPDLDWNLTNVRNYIGLTKHHVEPLTINGLTFKPFGQGSGSFGIPGDSTPPARFLRALFNKLTVKAVEGEDHLVVATNAVLNSVKIAKGVVITQRNTLDYTQYTSFMVSSSLTYYFSLYNNPEIIKVEMKDYDLNQTDIICLELENKPFFSKIK